MFKCKFCEKECISNNSLAQHQIRCKLNPDKINFHKDGFKLFNKSKNYTKQCFCQFCNKEFSNIHFLSGHVPSCLKNPKYKENLNKKSFPFFKGKHHTEKSKQLLRLAGGYRKGCGRGKQGWYKGYWCDSSYELAFVIYHLDHNISIQRNKRSFSYFYENREYKYFPDFIVNDIYYEIKGYYTKRDQIKIQAASPYIRLILLKDKDIFQYIEYVQKKYGTDFIKLYEGNPHNQKLNKCLICGEPAKNKVCSLKCSGLYVNQKYKAGIAHPVEQATDIR